MTAESLLRELLELHDLQKRNLANDYEAIRRIRRESDVKWEQARVLLYGEKAPDAKPRSAAEAERWKKRSDRAAVRRNSQTVA